MTQNFPYKLRIQDMLEVQEVGNESRKSMQSWKEKGWNDVSEEMRDCYSEGKQSSKVNPHLDDNKSWI